MRAFQCVPMRTAAIPIVHVTRHSARYHGLAGCVRAAVHVAVCAISSSARHPDTRGGDRTERRQPWPVRQGRCGTPVASFGLSCRRTLAR